MVLIFVLMANLILIIDSILGIQKRKIVLYEKKYSLICSELEQQNQLEIQGR